MIIHADNFSIYGTNAGLMLNGVYATISPGTSLPTDPDGVSGGRVLFNDFWTTNSGTTWRYVFQTGGTQKAGVAFRLWWPALPNNNNMNTQVIRFLDGSNNPRGFLSTLSTGQLRFTVIEGDDPATHRHTDTEIPVITAQGWYHIELIYQNNAGLIDVEVRVEGNPVIEAEAVVGTNRPIAQVGGFRVNISGDPAHYIKDLVVYNGSGTRNNDFLGSVLVTSLIPDSDVALNWTPTGASTGYQILDNVPPNNAQYISAPYDPDEPNYPDAYVGTLTSLPEETTSVKAVITYVRAAKSDGGDGALQVGLISHPDDDPTTVLGEDRPITVAQTYWRDIFEVDPATDAPWLPASVNDVQMQINRTA